MIAQDTVETIRKFSRIMVRELGFMNTTLAATTYSASAVHALLEIENHKEITAVELKHLLGLEKSSISRMLNKLNESGEIKEVQKGTDARYKSLQLTDQGLDTVKKINNYADKQVMDALNHILISDQKTIAQGLKFYAEALAACHKEKALQLGQNIEIVSGYRAGMIGRMTEMHGTYYSKNYNFGHFFEAKVAASIAEFSQRINRDCNKIWLAIHHDQIIGSVAIDGEDLNNHEAHLRWFILDKDYQGYGIGRKLLNEAINFCDQQAFSTVQLWTFSGLDAARKLYESFGFKLVKECAGDQWGKTVLEQQFTRKKLE